MSGVCQEPAGSEPTFSLIFPAYNAAGALPATWAELMRFLPHAPGTWEVLFVCDGCTDDTVDRLTALVKDGPANIRILNYAPNRGKGHAVRKGMEAARGRWRLFTDVDLAYRFDNVLRLADVLRGGAEVAIASRLHPQSRLVIPPDLQGYAYRRHLQSLVFSGVVRRLLPLAHRDTQAGLKGLSARAVQLLGPSLHCNGFGFDCELLVACQRHGIPVVEVPVTMNYDNARSTTGWRSMRRMLQEILAIRRGWLDTGNAPAVPIATERKAA
jgi:glycosyltransferase involved in cell wall biosynthesis